MSAAGGDLSTYTPEVDAVTGCTSMESAQRDRPPGPVGAAQTTLCWSRRQRVARSKNWLEPEVPKNLDGMPTGRMADQTR